MDLDYGKCWSTSKKDWKKILVLSYQILGVFYGDISIAPLYVFKNTFAEDITHSETNKEILGVLLLVFWNLTLVPLFKYSFIVLRADDNGEGGNFALYSLIFKHAKVSLLPNRQVADEALLTYKMEQPPERRNSSKVKKVLENHKFLHTALLILVLLGTCMVIGDGLLTPSISVFTTVLGLSCQCPKSITTVKSIYAVLLSSQFKELEEHAAMYYTRAVFFKFKEQATKAADYTIVHFQPLDAYEINAIYLRKNKENAALYTVFCQRDNNMVQCSCMRIESSQMLCTHIIFVLFCKGVAYIPERLLSRRWEKTDREFYKNERCMKEPVRRRCDDSATQSFRRGSMRGRMESLSNLGGTSQATFNFWKQGVETLILSLNNIILNDDKNEPWIPNVNPEEYAHVKAPTKGETRSKGAPKNVQKKYGNCGQYGHNRTTCPNPPVGVGPSQPGSQAASQQSQKTVISNSYYSLSQGNSHPVLFRDEQVRWN